MILGIGYGICFICTFIACFYNAIIAHAVYFFISSVGVCNNSRLFKFIDVIMLYIVGSTLDSM